MLHRLNRSVLVQAVTFTLITQLSHVSPAPTLTFPEEVTEGLKVVLDKPRVRYVLLGGSFTLTCQILICDRDNGSYTSNDINSNNNNNNNNSNNNSSNNNNTGSNSKDNVSTNSSDTENNIAESNLTMTNTNNTRIYALRHNITWFLPDGEVVYPDIFLKNQTNTEKTKRNDDPFSMKEPIMNISTTASLTQILRADWTVTDAKMADSGSYLCV
ncbi:hypothetical protein EGW08_018532 [Elysia chlorotica]|uniref:Ig-like domain-containing protein n=1 Tax=Elysia chlorotica TaxID=188477 RepID=A0A433SWL2_ELYCH|nr:hypothetical protein EGW08_018532 [Elysia chlorotica]